MAAPIIVATVTGSDARSSVSKEYGGKGADALAAKADPVYNAIGQVLPPFLISAFTPVCAAHLMMCRIHSCHCILNAQPLKARGSACEAKLCECCDMLPKIRTQERVCQLDGCDCLAISFLDISAQTPLMTILS